MALHADLLAISAHAEVPLDIPQGDSRVWLRKLRKRLSNGTYSYYDITGCTMKLAVRESYAAEEDLISAAIAPTANAAQGEFSISWDAAESAALVVPDGTDSRKLRVPIGVYDLEISDSTHTVTLQRGVAYLVRQVSR